METKENKLIRFIGIALTIYMVLWFWPILFGPFGVSKPKDPNPYIPMPVYRDGPLPPPPIRVEPVVNYPAPAAEDPDSHGSKAETDPVACTMDAKLCADGSAVGRVAPDCEFAKCPEDK